MADGSLLLTVHQRAQRGLLAFTYISMEAEDLTHPLPSTHGNSATYTKPTNLSLYSYHTLTHTHTLYGRSQGKTRSDRITQDWGRVAALHASYCQGKRECICDCLNWVLLYSVCYFIVISPYLCQLWVSCYISREYLDVLWHFMNI